MRTEICSTRAFWAVLELYLNWGGIFTASFGRDVKPLIQGQNVPIVMPINFEDMVMAYSLYSFLPIWNALYTRYYVQSLLFQYIAPMSLWDQPVRVRYPNCQNEVNTVLDFTAGNLTWLVVVVLFLLGFWMWVARLLIRPYYYAGNCQVKNVIFTHARRWPLIVTISLGKCPLSINEP